MFEKSKFKKKYPLLIPYVQNKELMKKLLGDSEFEDYYYKKSNILLDFTEKLKMLYSDEEVINIFLGHLNNFKSYNFKDDYDNLSRYIRCCKEFDNGNIDVLKDLGWKRIKSDPFYVIEPTVISLLFKKYYTTPVMIKGVDVLDLFVSQSLDVKKRLLELAKNNNLDFFAFVVEELRKYRISINNLEEILQTEVNDKIYHPITREKLGEKNFARLIVFYFNNAYYKDKEVINKLLEADNYELLTDILHFRADYKFCRYVKEGEYECDLFSLSSMQNYDRLNIICNYISPKVRLDVKYLANIKFSISDNEAYDRFYAKHSETLDLLHSLEYNIFKNLSIEEQKRLYTYIKSLDDNKRSLLVEEIKEINIEMRDLYKNEYANKFNDSHSIVDKAQSIEIKDTKNNVHNVRVYELKDEEPFTFLITVMHHKARLHTMNMYGRPAHKLTIDNPENFCRDLNGGSEIISTSMINERFIDTFVGPFADVMYIFADIKADDVLGICHEDGAYPPKVDSDRDLFERGEPVGPDDLMRQTISNRYYNEIAIRRKRKDGTRIMPTAILCYDEINDISLKHAEYFNIPIIVINTKTYRNLAGYTDERKEAGYRR